MKILSHRQVENRLKKLRSFMEHDVQSAIDGKADYLACARSNFIYRSDRGINSWNS